MKRRRRKKKRVGLNQCLIDTSRDSIGDTGNNLYLRIIT